MVGNKRERGIFFIFDMKGMALYYGEEGSRLKIINYWLLIICEVVCGRKRII